MRKETQMNKKIGYIVINSGGNALELDRYDRNDPLILMWGDHATLFTNHKDARNAIRRTQAYAKRHIHKPGSVWFNQRIVPLLAAE